MVWAVRLLPALLLPDILLRRSVDGASLGQLLVQPLVFMAPIQRLFLGLVLLRLELFPVLEWKRLDPIQGRQQALSPFEQGHAV